ncbi:MAG: RNA 2'-phosphotransferase [Cyanobacteria bacterium J06632_22]
MNPTDKRLKQISKYLSLHLRHQPEKLGLTLAPGGWVDITALLSASTAKGFDLTREELRQVVATNEKQRFSIDETGTRIRANQGHSVTVDLQLDPIEPPTVLYHGTAEKTLTAILKEGLLPMQRQHVHLSADVATAQRVGARHGKPVVLTVSALEMHHQGHCFYRSSNGVWLCDRIPPDQLQRYLDRS